MVTLEEFKRLEIRIAKIKEVTEHPNADRLYVLKIDLGDCQKQIVAGIRTSYSKEELLDKEIVVLNNLEPTLIRGVESQAMLLAASDEEGISILLPERQVKPGAIVK